MQLDELVKQINSINETLDRAEAVDEHRRDELLRLGAVQACRVYSELVEDPELERDLADLRQAQEMASDDARELLRRQGADLIQAEVRLLRRFGLNSAVAEELEVELSELDLSEGFESVNLDQLHGFRNVFCGLQEDLQDEAHRDRRKTRIWGGIMGMVGVVIGGGNAPLFVLAPPVAAASGLLSVGLFEEGRRRIFGG